MSELMRALARTFDIDSALMEVYGLDQHGLDSAWREAIGLEPLPSPEDSSEALSRPQRPEATIAPVLVPTFPPLEETSPAAVDSPAEGAEGSPRQRHALGCQCRGRTRIHTDSEQGEASAGTEEPQAEGGCGPASVQSGVVGELSLLMLLAMPLGLVVARRGRREGK